MKNLDICAIESHKELPLPFAEGGVRAGFPSPAQSYMEETIDLNKELVSHPEATFYARVKGYSMIDANLNDGDILLIDKSLEARQGDIVVAILNGEFTVKFLDIRKTGIVLVPANEHFSEIPIMEGDQFEVWGVVQYIIHKAERLH